MKQRLNDLLLIFALVMLWQSMGASASGGASLFIVLHEPSQDDNAFSQLAVALQDEQSATAKSIADAGWHLMVLPDDAKDSNKNPLPILKTLGVYDTINDSTHELLSVAPSSKLVAKETIPAGASADTVLSMMKARGKRK